MAFNWFRGSAKSGQATAPAPASRAVPSPTPVDPQPPPGMTGVDASRIGAAGIGAAGLVTDAGLALLESAPTPVPPPPPTPIDALVERLRQHPSTAESPDASDLLDLLSANADTMIRQLPAAAQASLAMCDDPALTRRQLAEKLSSDPALVQAVLKTANSAVFGAGREPVISIDPALDRIGVAGARSIIFANAVDGVLSRPGKEFNTMATAVWNHMVRTAPIARALAPSFGADGDEAFSIALLHDIGKLVIFDRISVLRATRRRDLKLSPEFVRLMLRDLHEPIGAGAVRGWNMGPRSERAIGFHHRRASDGEANLLAEVVFVAELADHAIHGGRPIDLHRVWFDANISADLQRMMKVLQGWEVPILV